MTSNKRDKQSEKRAFWARSDSETARSYAAFVAYRDQGPTRSLRRTAELVYGEGTKSVRRIEEWSRQNLWVARAEAWDMEQERQRALAREQAIVVHLDRAANLGRHLQARALAGIRELELRQAKGDSVMRPPVELVRYVQAGIAEERRALGLPSDAVVVDHRRGGASDPSLDALRRATEYLR